MVQDFWRSVYFVISLKVVTKKALEVFYISLLDIKQYLLARPICPVNQRTITLFIKALNFTELMLIGYYNLI